MSCLRFSVLLVALVMGMGAIMVGCADHSDLPPVYTDNETTVTGPSGTVVCFRERTLYQKMPWVPDLPAGVEALDPFTSPDLPGVELPVYRDRRGNHYVELPGQPGYTPYRAVPRRPVTPPPAETGASGSDCPKTDSDFETQGSVTLNSGVATFSLLVGSDFVLSSDYPRLEINEQPTKLGRLVSVTGDVDEVGFWAWEHQLRGLTLDIDTSVGTVHDQATIALVKFSSKGAKPGDGIVIAVTSVFDQIVDYNVVAYECLQ